VCLHSTPLLHCLNTINPTEPSAAGGSGCGSSPGPRMRRPVRTSEICALGAGADPRFGGESQTDLSYGYDVWQHLTLHTSCSARLPVRWPRLANAFEFRATSAGQLLGSVVNTSGLQVRGSASESPDTEATLREIKGTLDASRQEQLWRRSATCCSSSSVPCRSTGSRPRPWSMRPSWLTTTSQEQPRHVDGFKAVR
jgi:hypothetical protein